MDWEKLGKTLIKVLNDAGYEVRADISHEDDILWALSDYSEKHNEMLEYILMQKSEWLLDHALLSGVVFFYAQAQLLSDLSGSRS